MFFFYFPRLVVLNISSIYIENHIKWCCNFGFSGQAEFRKFKGRKKTYWICLYFYSFHSFFLILDVPKFHHFPFWGFPLAIILGQVCWQHIFLILFSNENVLISFSLPKAGLTGYRIVGWHLFFNTVPLPDRLHNFRREICSNSVFSPIDKMSFHYLLSRFFSSIFSEVWV